MKIEREKRGDIVVLRLQGKLLGGQDAGSMRTVVLDAIADGTPRVLVDLGEVSHANSTGLGILVSNLATLKRSGGDLRLLHVPRRIGSSLQTTWLNKVFRVYEDEDAAVASFDA
jgi:anti-sigma B factor antagonist